MKFGSFSVTATVAETLVRLDKMTGKQKDTKTMLDAAMKFLGNRVIEEYEEIRKNKDRGATPYVFVNNAVHYLYINALDGRRTFAEGERGGRLSAGKA